MRSTIHFQSLDISAKRFNHTGSFVPQAHVYSQIMLIRATETAVSDSVKDLVAVEMFTMSDSFNDAPIWEPL